MILKIGSDRELTNTNNYNSKKNENFGGLQALKDSFNSLSSKDSFFTNKKIIIFIIILPIKKEE